MNEYPSVISKTEAVRILAEHVEKDEIILAIAVALDKAFHDGQDSVALFCRLKKINEKMSENAHE